MRTALLHKFFLSCFLCFASFVLFAQTRSTNIQTVEGKKFYIHKIEKSQSLYAISRLYSISIDDLYRVNPELKAGAKANQEIKIPYNGPAIAAATPTTAAVVIDTAKFITYKILKGETVYSLSKKFNLSEKQLLAYNPVLNQGLKEGQVIVTGEKTKRKPVSTKENKEAKPIVTAVKEKPAVVKDKPVTVPVPVDSALLKPVSKPKKTSYNIALILPFKLDQINNMDANDLIRSNTGFPLVPGLAIDFYLGFKRAVDSLAGKDYELNLELYDIDDKDSLKLSQLVNDPKFKDLDFIFGPLYASGFKTISKKAKELHIPIVSPITQQNKILFNNFYISKTNPSQFTLLESLADYAMDSLMQGNAHVMLMSAFEKDKKEQAFVNAFKKYFNDRLKQAGKPGKDSVTVVKGIAGIKGSFMPGAKNVIISLSNNQVFVADFSTQLAMFADKRDIVLCGWESISNMENIDQEYLNQLHYTFPYQYNLVNTGLYNGIIDSYKAQQETYPSENYFIGFDIALYYLGQLRDQGPDFAHNLDNLPAETNYMRFKFDRPDNSTGFDNRGVYIFKYNDYQLQKTGWK